MKFIFIATLILFCNSIFADCGCEDRVMMNVTYMNVDNKIIKNKTIIGRWWPIHYSKNPYSDDFVKNEEMAKTKPNLLLEQRITKGESYKVVKKFETVSIKTVLNGNVKFPFIIEQGGILNSSNVKSIIEVKKMNVGCVAWSKIVVPEIERFLRREQPFILEEGPDGAGIGYTAYKLMYALGSSASMTLHFAYGYEGGCA